MLLLIGWLVLVNRKAGLKSSILLSLLQGVSGTIFIILLILEKVAGGVIISRVVETLSIDDSTHPYCNHSNSSLEK
ncbi:hypothetical protein [Clostridium frigidicarnis]|uniref:Uncharacterized protein n=1 Tax=Clostridium frigidicarnis TaxID=84698 RepID=A0A1I0XCK0_9CLOT|nr:hypothetical protein [Clostridium frigidicarnis]SFA98755.1 hypothetical protein SAMN04488528_100822 [Clostridium frigidicarnis]